MIITPSWFLKVQFAFLILLCCNRVIAGVQVLEAKLNNDDLKAVNARGVPEMYLFSATGELKLRALGYEDNVIDDLNEVLLHGETLYRALTAKELEQTIQDAEKLAVKHTQESLRKQRPKLSKKIYNQLINNSKSDIRRLLTQPLLSETEIVTHIKNTDLSPADMAALAADNKAYMLITYTNSAGWCAECRRLENDLSIHLASQQQHITLNWVKLSR